MAECSLCGDALQMEGGAILFTDNRGVPFEVCGKCEEHVDVLHGSRDENDIKVALDYISGCADNLEYRDTYETLMEFIKREESDAVPQEAAEETMEQDDTEEAAESADVQQEEAVSPEAADGKTGKYMPFLVGIVLVGILILAFALGGFRLG